METHAPSMIELSAPGLRELLLLGVVLVAAYLVVLLVRLRGPSPAVKKSRAQQPQEQPYGPWRSEPVEVGPEIPDQDFASRLAQSSISLEMQRLQREATQLRAEVAHLSEEVRQLKATHSVSPIYSEAMSLAEHGELPAGIAARCGISIGEAELVAALARREFSGAIDGDLESGRREP